MRDDLLDAMSFYPDPRVIGHDDRLRGNACGVIVSACADTWTPPAPTATASWPLAEEPKKFVRRIGDAGF